ncbi:hypothetical protein FACS1894200_10310 [Spirochaetia bacterium]|nr:hypothetical protein FACS1894200_10310 [Spirochaetia bacterium]
MRRWSHLIISIYLALATIGIFTFAATESLRSVDLWEDEFGTGEYRIQEKLCSGAPIEGEPVINFFLKGRTFPSGHLGDGQLRTIIAWGTRDVNAVIAQVPLIIEKAKQRTIKNTILLKLRI